MSPSTAIGHPFIELSETDSTNIYAMDRLQAGLASHGTAVFAHHQTSGKGQRGRNWIDEPGLNIALSVVLDCSFLSITRAFPISVMSAVACHDLFSRYTSGQTFVKWPNDLYWRDRKAGGILIESLIRGDQWQACVAGIGININQTRFPEFLANPVSLKQITGKDHDPVQLAKELCDCLQKRYAELQNNGFTNLLAHYNDHLFKRGEKVRLKAGPVAFDCIVRAVLENGDLCVEGALKEQYSFGEIQWVLSPADR